MDICPGYQQPMVLIPFDQYMKLINTNEKEQITTKMTKHCSISTQTSISSQFTLSSVVEKKDEVKNVSSPILLKPASSSLSSITTTTSSLLKSDSSKKATNEKECRLTVTCVSSTKSSEKIIPTTTTTTTTLSMKKRKRSPSPHKSTLPINKEPILNDLKLAHYTKVILNKANIRPSQDAEEIKRRIEYAKYSLEWRLRRAIDLARMDLEQKFIK